MVNLVSASSWSSLLSPDLNLLSLSAGNFWVQNGGDAYSITSPVANTLRFEVHPGDVWTAVDSASKERSEISGTTNYAVGTDIHVAYGFQIEPGAANHAAWMGIGQFHQTTNDGNSPPFSIEMRGEKMAINISTPTGGDNYIWTDSANIIRGHTYQIQIDADFDPTNGHLKVVRDGVTLVNYSGPLGWANMGSVYWKEGIYRAASDTSIAVDYSNLSITTGAVVTTPTTPVVTTPPVVSDPVVTTPVVTAPTTPVVTTPTTPVVTTPTAPAGPHVVVPEITPNYFTQSGSTLKVSGWGPEVGTKVTFHDGAKTMTSTIDSQGHWSVSLTADKAVHTYTYETTFAGKTSDTEHLIVGTTGKDTLTAQSDGDFLWGRGGGDTFVLGANTADQTTIGWFTQGRDHIKLQGFDASHTTLSQVDDTHWYVTDGAHSATFVIANTVHLTSSDWVVG